MPLWRIYSHSSTFSATQRDALAQAITDLYVSHVRLPPFYVNVIFVDVDEHHTYVGGTKKTNFVRVTVEQIARVMPSQSDAEGAAYRKAWMDRIGGMLKPHIADRVDLEWEMHISETPRDLWRIQGLDPPPAHSDEERKWRDVNKAVPWQ